MDIGLYRIFRIPKANGKVRIIHAPCDELKTKQRTLLENEYRTGIGAGPYAMGFVRKRSIRNHALSHVGKRYVVEIDIKDFFPSVRPRHVVDAWKFERFLPSEIASRGMPIDGMDWKRLVPPIGLIELAFIRNHRGEYCLPQGSPLSGYLANLAMKPYDFKIAKLLKGRFQPCERAGYSRYADNLAFSAESKRIIPIARHAVERILANAGFQINLAKFKVMRQSSRQRICGVVVNKRITIAKNKRHEVRGRVHNLFMNAVNGKEVDLAEFRSVEGYLSFARHIDPVWADRFRESIGFVRTFLESKLA